MTNHLPVDDVIALATRVVTRLRLRIPSVDELRVALQDRYGYAQLISDGEIQLWVDRLYIAYSRMDECKVHYVYLTDKHIEEEYRSYQMARSERKNNVFLPANIDAQFKKALHKMVADKKRCVILKVHSES